MAGVRVTGLRYARMAASRTVHVVQEVAGGDGGPRLAALCGGAIGPLRDWSNYTWAAGAVPCSECERAAPRRRVRWSDLRSDPF